MGHHNFGSEIDSTGRHRETCSCKDKDGEWEISSKKKEEQGTFTRDVRAERGVQYPESQILSEEVTRRRG